MEEKDNQLEGKPHRAVRSRLGMLKGQLAVPDDFDRMGQEEIADLFEGIAEH